LKDWPILRNSNFRSEGLYNLAILLGILLKRLLPDCALGAGPYHSVVLAPRRSYWLFCSSPMVALSRNVANKHAM
jgi:hypothetical protein